VAELLGREQAVPHLNNHFILATIQEYCLKCGLAWNIYCIALPVDNEVCMKCVMVYPFS